MACGGALRQDFYRASCCELNLRILLKVALDKSLPSERKGLPKSRDWAPDLAMKVELALSISTLPTQRGAPTSRTPQDNGRQIPRVFRTNGKCCPSQSQKCIAKQEQAS